MDTNEVEFEKEESSLQTLQESNLPIVSLNSHKSETDIFIIFINGEMKGYVDNLSSAETIICDEAKNIVIQKKKQETNIRVFIENEDSKVKVYTQTLGNYINGSVILTNVLEWKRIPRFTYKI